jgi:hypothetical protein
MSEKYKLFYKILSVLVVVGLVLSAILPAIAVIGN